MQTSTVNISETVRDGSRANVTTASTVSAYVLLNSALTMKVKVFLSDDVTDVRLFTLNANGVDGRTKMFFMCLYVWLMAELVLDVRGMLAAEAGQVLCRHGRNMRKQNPPKTINNDQQTDISRVFAGDADGNMQPTLRLHFSLSWLAKVFAFTVARRVIDRVPIKVYSTL